jgi:hypothetical protein
MGYTTDFEGICKFDSPLTEDQVKYIQNFSSTRRMKRSEALVLTLADPVREAVGLPVGNEGEYYVGNNECCNRFGGGSVINQNCPPETQPGLWCQWTVSDDGTEFKWDGGEKFYCYVEWLQYLIDNFFEPWGKKMTGAITWQGEDEEDTGTITVTSNHMVVEYSDEERYKESSQIRKGMFAMFKSF